MNPRFIEEMSWRMGEVYAAVTDQLLINLARHFKYIKEGSTPGGAWQYQIRKLAEMGMVTRESEQIILNALGDADAALQEVLEEAIRDGLKGVDKPLIYQFLVGQNRRRPSRSHLSPEVLPRHLVLPRRKARGYRRSAGLLGGGA